MSHLPDREQSSAFASLALTAMAKCEVAPTPAHYEIFFTHIAGLKPELSRVLTPYVNEGKPVPFQLLQELYDAHFAQSLPSNVFEEITAKLGSHADAILTQIAQAGEHTKSYGRALDVATGQIDKGLEQGTVQMLVGHLAQATRAMQARTQHLEAELKAASGEVQSLRGRMETIRKESLTDQLTGLANRKCFDDRLREAIEGATAEGTPLSLLIGDIDFFKKFNDTWGHQTGDQVLKLVAHCFKEQVKGRDTAARYGGEEFVVILPQTSLANAKTLAEQIRGAVQSKKVMKRSTGETLGTITVSIGAAQFAPGDTSETILHRADACLYAAKHAGRNRVIAENEVDVAASGEHAAQARARKTAA